MDEEAGVWGVAEGRLKHVGAMLGDVVLGVTEVDELEGRLRSCGGLEAAPLPKVDTVADAVIVLGGRGEVG